ncbi:hypothetical protein Tco_0549631 [Tanacetum coccineum]
MYFKYSTGLIPPKKSRGEPENRQVSRKIRTPRAVVIQEPPAKKTQESSEKLKGIEMLSKAALLGIDTQTAIKDNQHASPLKNKTGSLSEGTGVSPGVPNELTGVLAVSSEGVGTSPKVLDETLYNYEAQSDDDVWGSTDEETNKDKNEDDDKDDVNKEEEDEEESVNEEDNVDEENEEESDDNDKSFDITNTDDEITKSDSDDHEISKEGETVFEIEEEEIANSEHEEDDTKGEDQKTEEEPKRDDQANEAEVGVPDLVTNKEKSEFLQSTSSHSISLNFDVPLVQNEPFHEVKVSIIPKSTQQPPSTPPLPVIEDPAALELKQADHSAAIFESIKSQVSSIVKDSLALNIGETSEAKESLTEFELKKILMEIMKRRIYKGKPPSKSSKIGKSTPINQLVKEPEHEVQMDFEEPTFENVANDAEVPHTIDDAPEQPWFNEMINAEKPPLTFDELMSKSIEFSAYAMNRLKLTKLTREVLQALTLKEKEGRLIIPIEVCFNNDLEYLKGDKAERTYSSSITKTPATRYTMKWIEDLIPNLWSPILINYDKDAALGIKH